MVFPTGAIAIAQLCKIGLADTYSAAPSAKITQIPYLADRIGEPSDSNSVSMLDALPPLEAEFYGSEASAAPPDAELSRAFHDELEGHYGFFGGDASEQSRYLGRDDLPSDMWCFLLRRAVRAVSGVR